MTDELKTLLLILIITVPTGLIIGLIICKCSPNSCKSYAIFCMNKKWPLFAFGVVFFAIFSLISFLISKPYFGIFFAFFSLFELYVLFACGFKKITPEQIKKIDDSKPQNLTPFKFWKKYKKANKVDGADG